MSKLLVLLAASAALAGCASVDLAPPPGQPKEFQGGWQAGCASGFAAAGNPYYQFARDLGAYDGQALYRQGWDAGFAQCRGQYEALGRL